MYCNVTHNIHSLTHLSWLQSCGRLEVSILNSTFLINSLLQLSDSILTRFRNSLTSEGQITFIFICRILRRLWRKPRLASLSVSINNSNDVEKKWRCVSLLCYEEGYLNQRVAGRLWMSVSGGKLATRCENPVCSSSSSAQVSSVKASIEARFNLQSWF